MKSLIAIILFLGLHALTKSFCQTSTAKQNSIGISIPLIWNSSNASFYSGQKSSGKAISYGVDLSYSKLIYKGIFAMLGVGYFNQEFNIVRPFKFESQLGLLYSTESYSYKNLKLSGGIGYKKEVNKSISVEGIIMYNKFNSFKQKYVVNKEYGTYQINNKAISIGNSLSLNIGMQKEISKRISAGVYLLFPVSVHWNDDLIFYEYANYQNTQQIAQNKLSVGTSFSCNYHF